LSEGEPLSWEETHKYADHVRRHGVEQFVHLYNRLNVRRGDILKWGDEIEYFIIRIDDASKTARVSMRAEELLRRLQEPERKAATTGEALKSLWRPEYSSYCIEGTPGAPYSGQISCFNEVELNMKLRRDEVEKLLEDNEILVSMSIFPRLGVNPFTQPHSKPDVDHSFTRSLFWPNEATFQGHPRFRTLTRNIRMRRGEKVCINVPVYPDENTPSGYLEDLSQFGDDGTSQAVSEPGHIYMDAMGFGMGLSCLQVTFQACDIAEAAILYDQLAPLCPILLALTASSPIHRGWLSDVDCRWDIISASVDCRTRGERGMEDLKPSERRIGKSRYASISSYISKCATKFKYNDIELPMDEPTYERLKAEGIDELMSRHIAHLFIRDTVSLFSEKLTQDDKKDTDHFENIQSTNWQTMRFKPPPPSAPIGWRVEFRPCELQFTDFENAAVVCFIVLVTRVILSFNYNMLIPISKVDENMKRSQVRDAITTQKFFFRTNIDTSCDEGKSTSEPVVREMTLDQIMNGDGENFKGLIPIVTEYLRDNEVDAATMCTLSNYLGLLRRRASGKLKSNARYMRDFVLAHQDYKKDSRVSEQIQYDLLKRVHAISKGEMRPDELYGDAIMRT